MKVSWQVTGTRQDDFAEDHRIVVEELKRAADRGKSSGGPPGSIVLGRGLASVRAAVRALEALASD
jgi:hypothetical protein